MSDFLVKRDELRRCLIAESEVPELDPGQALLRVGTFGLTANNVTYAVFGEAMSYWGFFPAQDGWGRVPVWGFAEVERSKVEGVQSGARLYGYLPPSSHLVVMPADVDERGFVDGDATPSGAALAVQRLSGDRRRPFCRPDTEEMQVLLRPLFLTSFLIDDQLADEGLATRGPVLISSASSKTAIGVAFLLAQREGVELVGVTSPRSAEFVEGLGIYGRSVTYDAIDSLERGPATFVDIAGDREVRRAVHSDFGHELLRSMAVGATHWEELGASDGELPGPSPTFFFAPDRVVKRSEDWGGARLQTRVADAWHPFCEWAGGWLNVVRGHGFAAVQGAYLDVLEGRVDPTTAHVLSLQ